MGAHIYFFIWALAPAPPLQAEGSGFQGLNVRVRVHRCVLCLAKKKTKQTKPKQQQQTKQTPKSQ